MCEELHLGATSQQCPVCCVRWHGDLALDSWSRNFMKCHVTAIGKLLQQDVTDQRAVMLCNHEGRCRSTDVVLAMHDRLRDYITLH